jgi:hypothetical protein
MLLGSWMPTPSKQALELLLLSGFVLPCLQQLLWLLEAHAHAQVDPRASAALWAQKIQAHWFCCSIMGTLNLLLYEQKPASTLANESQAPCFAIMLVPGGFPPPEHGGTVLSTMPFCRRAPTSLSKCGNPGPPLSGNLPLCGCPETCFPKAWKGPGFPTMPDYGRAHTSPL